MAAAFLLLIQLDSGEEVERGSWHSLEQAIEQGQLWLATLSDCARFSVTAGGVLAYSKARERTFAPPRRSRPSGLSALCAGRPERLAA